MQIHLLHVNDVHSALENHMRLGASLRALRDRLRARGEPVLTFDIGDTIDRVRPETEGTLGMINAAMLAALQVDAWVFGNNEGLTVPVCQWSRLAERSQAVVLGTNVRLGGRTVPHFTNRHVFTVARVRVGVFGVTPNYEAPYRVLGVDVLDPFACAAEAAAALRRQGCHIVIALSHLGLAADRRLAKQVDGLDVILGGHTHHFLEQPEWVGKTAIVQAGKHALAYGHTVVDVDLSRGRVRGVDSRLVYTDPDGAFDQAMLSAYRGYLPDATARLAEEVLTLDQPLPVRFDRESAFANALAEVLLRAYPCDLALVHSGALNASLLPGRIRVGHIHGACATPTRPVVLTLPGRALWEILEKSLQAEYYHRQGIGFGFRGAVVGALAMANAEADVEWPREGQARLRGLRIGGSPVAADRTYRVATSEYLWLSAVFNEFREADAVEFQVPLMRELLLTHLADPGVLNAALQPRFRIVGQDPPAVP